MSKKILELSLSLFLIVCSVSLIVGIISVKSLLDSRLQLLEEAQKSEAEAMKFVNEFSEVMTEVGYASLVLSMSEERMIPPAKADILLEKSVDKIGQHSERFGELARYMNEYRILKSRERRPY